MRSKQKMQNGQWKKIARAKRRVTADYSYYYSEN